MNKEYKGQAEQDKFVCTILKKKRNGYFLEIGSNDPILINNTYILEKEFDWRGIMVEYDSSFLPLYKEHRPNSIHVIDDAIKINYDKLLKTNNFPSCIDYLQIDLEVSNDSTMRTLEKIDNDILDAYKFATITFEHDEWAAGNHNTRERSRNIFKQRGYVCVFEDISNDGIFEPTPYEDWYVHPDLVDMEYIYELIKINKKNYKDHSLIGKAIHWRDIEYL
jgi:hypothetical protein